MALLLPFLAPRGHPRGKVREWDIFILEDIRG